MVLYLCNTTRHLSYLDKKMKKKIYFWSPVPVHHFTQEDHPYAQLENNYSSMFIATGFAYLNSYLRRNRNDLYEQVEWCQIDFLSRSADNLLSRLIQDQIDLLLVSVYIWNAEEIISVLKTLHPRLKDKVVVVVGGPSVDPQRDKQYLDRHYYFDYAVYGPGEVAFTNILDLLLNHRQLSLLNSRNLAWRSEKGNKIADYEFVRDPHCSPILDSEHLFEKIKNNSDYQNYRLVLPYETSKGCPYKCSFCDWGSGLSHKVYHRKWSWEDELDFLGRIGITDMHLADANFGMHKQDWEIVRTLARLKKNKGYNFLLHTVNFSKLNKTEVMALADFLYKENLYLSSKFSLQDTNPNVLAHIDRPDIPWAEHKTLIEKLCKANPTMVPRVEIIQGLPGQTRATWEQTLLDIADYYNVIFPWFMLPNSPGASTDYRKNKKIKTIKSICQVTGSVTEIVIETLSYNFDDYCYFTILAIVAGHPLLQMRGPQVKQQFFDLVKSHTDLDSTIQKIKVSLQTAMQANHDKNHVHMITGSFLDAVVKSNRNQLDINFVKQWVLRKYKYKTQFTGDIDHAT